MTDVSTVLPGCMQVTNQLFHFLDQSNYEGLVGLFVPNGSWQRQGETLHARDQIMQAMLKRSVTQRIRHIVTNGFIAAHSPAGAAPLPYMLAYCFDDGTLHTGPVEIARPLRMSVLRAAMKQTEGGWKVAVMTLTPEFEFVADNVPPS